jgi:hypothetical protein
VLLAHSAIGPRFHGSRTLASFSEPAGLRLAPGAVAAVRLSGEGVALLWPTRSRGELVLDGAGVAPTGRVRIPSVLAVSGEDVRLGAVAAGPDNELVVLLDVARGAARAAIFAARSNVAHRRGGLRFGSLTQLAAPGVGSDPSVAVDPDSDRAVAVWQTRASIEYSVGSDS